eukprot:2139509-Pyramimonas_sp.AAC.1
MYGAPAAGAYPGSSSYGAHACKWHKRYCTFELHVESAGAELLGCTVRLHHVRQALRPERMLACLAPVTAAQRRPQGRQARRRSPRAPPKDAECLVPPRHLLLGQDLVALLLHFPSYFNIN